MLGEYVKIKKSALFVGVAIIALLIVGKRSTPRT